MYSVHCLCYFYKRFTTRALYYGNVGGGSIYIIDGLISNNKFAKAWACLSAKVVIRIKAFGLECSPLLC